MTTELDCIRSWFAYMAEARRGYFTILEKLSPAELSRDRGASFPTLLDILAHSQGALWFWMTGCSKSAFPPPEKEPSDAPTIAELRGFEEYLQGRIESYLSSLTEADLTRTVSRQRGHGSDHDCQVPFRDAFWHLVEEELQHRGEINALLWQVNVDPPVYSWTRWAHTIGRIKDPPG